MTELDKLKPLVDWFTLANAIAADITAWEATKDPDCTCGPTTRPVDDDPACPIHGCRCTSVAGHLVSPCSWGRPR